MEPGVFFPPAILRSEIKGARLNRIRSFQVGMMSAEEGATRTVRQFERLGRFDAFRNEVAAAKLHGRTAGDSRLVEAETSRLTPAVRHICSYTSSASCHCTNPSSA
jgi:hypothetical protein